MCYPYQYKFNVHFRGYTKKGKLGRKRTEEIIVGPPQSGDYIPPEEYHSEMLRRGIVCSWQTFGQVVQKIEYLGRVPAESDAD